MTQDYFYWKAGGDYRWHIQQKCLLAIGREPIAMMDTSDNKTMLRFDPPLNEVTEKPLIDAIFADSNTACNAPTVTMINSTYRIKDIYEWRDELEANIGFPVTMWFTKSVPEKENPDYIDLHFEGKVLAVKDKKAVEDAVKALTIGWV